MKLEVGMYLRTKDGEIHKIKSINDEYIKYENDFGIPYESKEYIVKASYNIIDILEVGDYVNGSEILDFKYEFIEENDNFINFAVVTENCYLEDTDSWIIEKNIKSVITHEQIEQMAYKVGE